MNDTRFAAVELEPQQEEEISLFPIMIALAKRKRLVFGLPLVAMVLAAAVSMILPPVYKADTKLLPPQQSQSGAASLLSQLGGVAGAVAGGSLKNPSEVYVGMLKSRTVADNLIRRFDLKKAYDTESEERARKKLEENTVIAATKDGLITVEVEDQNKAQVAKLANAYVEELLKLTKVLAVTEAAQRRLFFERQLEMSKNNLANAEIALKRAMDTHGVVSVDAESRSLLETTGRLRAQISAKEIELNSMSAFVTANNPAYLRTQEQLNSLRAELTRLENGRPSTDSNAQSADKQSGLENIKILRDVKYYELLYELLAKQYEAARLDEAKDSSVIQVLDPAVEPERRFKPKRSIIVLVTGLCAFLIAAFIALLAEFKAAAMREPSTAAKWTELKQHLLAKK